MLMTDLNQTTSILREFKSMGLSISIDDFGIGYSSLYYLKRLPIDALKIDRSFVQDIPSDPDSKAIASAIIAMAQNMNMNVIAEGVETVQQVRILQEKGCSEMQGFLFSRPIPPSDILTLLHSDVGATH
jgi:EAL domain-containing protein (putative c-di-GMP-specific phosphodiesterase class I)